MMKDSFAFQQFVVRQDCCAMKVGTDGVLLGAWATPLGASSGPMLDIGTGTGLIALMLAQRFPTATVDGIDIDEAACRQASENVQGSPFADRIAIQQAALQDFQTALQAYQTDVSYRLIVSNPPYFVDSLKNPDGQRCLARHADTLSDADLFRGVTRLLADDGRFAVIIPMERLRAFLGEAAIAGLFLTDHINIKTTPRKPVKRVLLGFARHRPSVVNHDEVCLLDADGSRSSWYRQLTKEFYLM